LLQRTGVSDPRSLAGQPVTARAGRVELADMSDIAAPEPTRLPNISFEFFPPKTEDMERSLWETTTRLAPLSPKFVSVTYGAGGSTRERTHSTITRILNETALVPAAHLTCVNASKGDIDDVVAQYHDVGVRHIVALRGDPTTGIGTPYVAHPDGYKTSADLVASIKRRYPDIDVTVSAITQVFFDNDLYFRYLDRVRARGIDIPILPGIMPMHNFKQARSFVTRAGTSVPAWLDEKFDGLDNDAETRKLVAATVAAGQVQKLAKQGVSDFHFYTMNRADLVFAISHLLGFRPNGAQKAA
jgi:methylenetetrahydrofolate reductase (NADPH)